MKKIIFTIALLISVLLLAVSASAEISVKNGTVTGLDGNSSYEYASVTAENYLAPIYNSLPAGSTKIEGLSVGLWLIRNVATSETKTVWIQGSSDDRNDIGDVYYNATLKKDVVRVSNIKTFKEGVWTGYGAYNNAAFATYYISDVGGHHLLASDAEGIENKTVSNSSVVNKLKSIYYRYAYASEEIIPVEELFTISFNVGVRQGSLNVSFPASVTNTDMKTTYVLYTMDENGKVHTHEASFTTVYALSSSKTNHIVNIKESFPDATGWVIGIDIYPFKVLPRGLTFRQEGTRYLNTIFFIEYVPGGYTTKHKSGTVAIPFQYNGANSAYIEGYGDGSFKPDGNITKAELSTIITRLFNKDTDLSMIAETRFSDYTINDWFSNSMRFVEYIGGFEHIEGKRVKPYEELTRGEFAQILYSVTLPDKAKKCTFKDINEDHPYFTAISSLEEAGVINGYEDGSFRPYAKVTRAEAVAIINRVINLEANEKTVIKSTLENRFDDIDSHWAEWDILMAANSNVKTPHHQNASVSGLLDTGSTIQLETDHIRLVLDKSNGKTISAINKYDGTDVLLPTASPWFTYITSKSGVTFTPTKLEITDNRLCVTYLNGVKAYFIIDVKKDYFTVELDSEIPIGVGTIRFGNLSVKTEYSEEDTESFRLSGVMMNYNTNSSHFPGGLSKATNAIVMRKFKGLGGKIAIAFSKFGGKVEGKHRAILKDIVNAMDPEVATVSRKGGAYTADHTDVYGDYVILSSGFTASTALETAQVMKKYSIDQLDMHQGGSTFIQGEFNFKCAAVSGESFTTAKSFYERVGYIAKNEGIQLGMHTYSSLVPANALTITADPKWQKQIEYARDKVLTLASDVSSSVRNFPTNEDASILTLASANVPWSGPETRYYLIDEEIVLVTAFNSTGLTTVTRGQCGTKAAAHLAGTEIRQLQCWYGMFQPIPGSELFYHVADLTAQAYNDGGFEMIYLDGLESFAPFVSSSEAWYYYASFIHRVVSQCNDDPIIEGSAFPLGFWTARARGGAWDHSHRDYKNFNSNHLNSNKTLLSYYCTATLGWFHYSPDMGDTLKNTSVKTVFRDDLDHMGSIGIAFDMTTVCQPFSVANFKNYKSLADNTMYYSLYSRLRKGGYFSPAVKQELRLGINEGKEYKLEEMADGTWAFREMTYLKHKVYDMTDELYVTGNGTNPYNAQTPYIRIEQRYSTLGENAQVLYAFDENAQVTAGTFNTTATGGTSRRAYKIKVYGNASETDAVMLSLNNELNFCIPLNYSGWREFILMDADNSDHPGYTFSGENAYFRGSHSFNNTSVKVLLCGDCTGVRLDDLVAYMAVNAPAVSPSVTVGGKTITFNTTLRSGEYLEYFPELNKAYKHSYNVLTGGTNGNALSVSEVSFNGSISVPAGNFTYTYNATGTTNASLRAQVVLGLKSADVIKNEATWTAPTVNIEEGLQWITLK